MNYDCILSLLCVVTDLVKQSVVFENSLFIIFIDLKSGKEFLNIIASLTSDLLPFLNF